MSDNTFIFNKYNQKFINNIEFKPFMKDRKLINQNIFIKKKINKNTNQRNNKLFKSGNINKLNFEDKSNTDIIIINQSKKIKNQNIINNYSLTKKNKTSNHKRMFIYQNQSMHTEVIGTIMYNFHDYHIDIYFPHYNNYSNCIPYYEEIFRKKITYVNTISEQNYYIIIILTAREIDTINIYEKRKYILINHENSNFNKEFINLSLTPIVKSDLYILPIYECINNNSRINQISIIGTLLSHQRNIPNILKLVSFLPMYKICLFTRYVNQKHKDIFLKYNNFYIYEKANTKTMINIIRKSKFIYTADTENYTENGIRDGILTGMIPLGLNNNIPLIMTKRLNLIYNLSGVIEYEKDILELKDILINFKEEQYKELLVKSKSDNKRICLENKIKFNILEEKI